MKERKSYGIIILISVLLVAVISYIVLNIVFSPYWDSIYPPMGYLSFTSFGQAESDDSVYTKAQAEEDIDYLVKKIGRVHPLCADGIPDIVSETAENVKAEFGDEVDSYQLWRGCAKVIHMLNDSQSMVLPSFKLSYLKEHRELIDGGYSLTAVNGTDLQKLFDENKEILSYETEAWGVKALLNLLDTREGLKLLGLYDNGVEYTYVDASGHKTVRKYTPDDFYFYNSEGTNDTDAVQTLDIPYRSAIYNEKAAGLTFDSLAYDDDLKRFLYDFFVDIGDRGISNLIIDLRDCQSGSSQVLDEILMYTDFKSYKTPGGVWRLGPYMMKWKSEETKIIKMDVDIMFGGNIYVLTSSNTFGSATLAAEILQDNGMGSVVGEECGNLPSGYGEVAAFETPNSALLFQISSKQFYRIDEKKNGQPIIPDYRVDPDQALEKALELIN